MLRIDRIRNDRARACRLAVAGLVALAMTVALCGCGNDGDDTENPMDPGPSGPARSTPSELLTSFFEQVYSQQDSTLYPLMLDDAFTFRFLQDDADSLRDILGNDDFWGKSADVASTKAMFRSPEVTGVTLNISVGSEQPDTSCADCRRLETTVTLRISTVGDGTEPLTFSVDSPQTFVVKHDASDSTKWVLLRQIDRPSSSPKSDRDDAESVESKSWGNMKALWWDSSGKAARYTRATDETSWGRLKSLFAESVDRTNSSASPRAR